MGKSSEHVRCKKCGRLLFKGRYWDVEIKCPKCDYVQTLNGAKKSVDILYKESKITQHIERSDRQ